MRKLLLVLFVATLAFSGCGGGSDKGSADVSASGSTETTTEAQAGANADTSFSGKGSGDFCALAAKYVEEFKSLSDEADTAAAYKKVTAAVDEMAAKAPSEIKADVTLVNKSIQDLDKLAAKYDYDFAKIPEDEAKAINMDSVEVGKANQRVEAYLGSVCKIDVQSDGTTDSTTDATSDTPETTTEP